MLKQECCCHSTVANRHICSVQRLELLLAGSLVVAALLQACWPLWRGNQLLTAEFIWQLPSGVRSSGLTLTSCRTASMNSSHHTFRTNASQPRDAAASALQEQLLAREHRMESQRTRKKAAAAAQRAATAAGGGGCCSAVLEATSRHEDVSVGAVCTSFAVWPPPVFPCNSRGEGGSG